MSDRNARVRVSVDTPLEPAAAFGGLLEELDAALERRGWRFESGEGGFVRQGDVEVGRVTAWHPGERVVFAWHPASWAPEEVTEMEVRVEATGPGSRLVVEHRGWSGLVGDGDRGGWFASELVVPLLTAATPGALGDWLTDRLARRPWGADARAVYGDPLYHYPNFRAILGELALEKDDYLLEVACGGGALLKEALRTGCRAAAVDHSRDMVRLAREANAAAVAEGRLDVRQGTAEHLPFDDDTFSCAAMTGVFGFLENPVSALAEIRRVLRPGGRFVGLGSDPFWKGTPAAPEPMASRLRFYGDAEHAELARRAGFTDVRVVRRDLEGFAREVGVPEEHLPLFAERGAPLLLTRKE